MPLTSIMFLIGVPVVLSIPFYFFNRWLLQKVKPRDDFRQFILYMVIVLPFAFLYLTAGLYIVIQVLQLLNSK